MLWKYHLNVTINTITKLLITLIKLLIILTKLLITFIKYCYLSYINWLIGTLCDPNVNDIIKYFIWYLYFAHLIIMNIYRAFQILFTFSDC